MRVEVGEGASGRGRARVGAKEMTLSIPLQHASDNRNCGDHALAINFEVLGGGQTCVEG